MPVEYALLFVVYSDGGLLGALGVFGSSWLFVPGMQRGVARWFDVRDSPRLVLRPQLSLITKIRHISSGGDSIYHG